MKNIPKDTWGFHYHNANPKGKRTGDCVIRAIATATDKSWDKVLDDLVEIAHKYKLSPTDKKCYGKYLESLGWHKQKQPRKDDNTKFTGEEFCDLLDSPDRDYLLEYHSSIARVIAHIGGHHIVCIMEHNGGYKIHDIWNSSYGCIGNYWTK